MHVKHREGITCHTQDMLYFAFPIFLSLWSLVLQAQDSLKILCKHLDAKLDFKIKRCFFYNTKTKWQLQQQKIQMKS